MRWVKRIGLWVLKIFLLLVATMMIRFQIPELRYDFGTHVPVDINSVNQLNPAQFSQATFAAVEGTADLTKAATYASHGVPFTYFLLNGYDSKIVVRSPELVDEEWADIAVHMGRLRPYRRMPFSRTVRVGFQQLFGVEIPGDAFFLARDDVPRPNGWSIGALAFASILWCTLAYFFFVRSRLTRRRTAPNAG